MTMEAFNITPEGVSYETSTRGGIIVRSVGFLTPTPPFETKNPKIPSIQKKFPNYHLFKPTFDRKFLPS
jgi:hypothetical protein